MGGGGWIVWACMRKGCREVLFLIWQPRESLQKDVFLINISFDATWCICCCFRSVFVCVCGGVADQMWYMWVKVFSLMHPWCLSVKHKKEGTNLEWGCCFCCHSTWCPAQLGRHIGPGNENVVSHWGEEGSELVNLSGRSDTSSQCWQSVWCHTSRLCPPPLLQLLSL